MNLDTVIISTLNAPSLSPTAQIEIVRYIAVIMN